jgi:hypothetical protein
MTTKHEAAGPTVHRTWNEIWKGPATLWPPDQGMMPDPEESQRHRAIYHVLQRIPADDYKRLVDGASGWQWFIPHELMLGEVYPFTMTSDGETSPDRGEIEITVTDKDGGNPRKERVHLGGTKSAPLAVVLYLSPLLERAGWNIVVAVVAHELAHRMHGHHLFCGEEYDTQEAEAWATVARWGFSKEARFHAAEAKAYATREANLLKKLQREREEQARRHAGKSGSRGGRRKGRS